MNYRIKNKILIMTVAVAFTGTSLFAPLRAQAQLAEVAGIAAVCALAPVSKVAISYVSGAISGSLADLFAFLPTSAGDATVKAAQVSAAAAQVAAAAAQVAATAKSVALALSLAVPVADVPVSVGQLAKSAQDGAKALQDAAVAKEKLLKDNTEANNTNLADCIIYGAGQLMLNQLTDNIISWIQGGFNGSPSFAIDTHALFLDLADSVAGDLAQEIRSIAGLASCEFTPNWTNDLANSVDNSSRKYARNRFKDGLSCPFGKGSLFNIDASTFFSVAESAFEQGGGMASFEASLEDAGNPIGARILVNRELLNRQDETRRIQEQKLSWSNGFIDLIDTNNCNYPASVAAGMKDFPPEAQKIYQKTYCQTTTPGKIIEGQLTKVTGLDMDRLGVSDSLNKIVSAFMKQITNQVKQGIFNAIAPSSSTAKTKVITNDTTPPTVPQGVSARYINANEIEVTWSQSSDKSGVFAYYVRRNLNEQVVSVLASRFTYFNDIYSFIPTSSYSYTVSAIDTKGNESMQSAVFTLAPRQASSTTCPLGYTGVPPCTPCPTGTVGAPASPATANTGPLPQRCVTIQ